MPLTLTPDAFYRVVPHGARFRVMHDKLPLIKTRFKTVQDAKVACIAATGVNPVRCYGDEVVFDNASAVHRALALIEYRHDPIGEIVAVGKRHYVKRRTRFGVEIPIRYRLTDAQAVTARNDSQLLVDA